MSTAPRKLRPPSKRLLPINELLQAEPRLLHVGDAPPERHAARLVAEMARWLVGMRVYLNNEMVRALRRSRSHLGSPKAQQRFAERLRKAGGAGILEIQAQTGKRGRWQLAVIDWHVIDPQTDTDLDGDDDAPIPEQPWLECSLMVLNFDTRPGQPKDHFARVFLVTHHAMQRLAERCGARVPLDLIKALQQIWRGVSDEVIAKKEKLSDPRVRYIPVKGGTAVLSYDEDFDALIVKTILDEGMQVPTPTYINR